MNEPVTSPLPLQQMMDSLGAHNTPCELCLACSVILPSPVMLKQRLWLNKRAFMEQRDVKPS